MVSFTKLFVLFISLIVTVAGVFACSCMSRGDFLQVSDHYKHVVQAKIIAHGSKLKHGNALHESMQIEIQNILKGTKVPGRIELEGDQGWQCRDYVDAERFSIGSEHIMVLRSDEAEQTLAGCGEIAVKRIGEAYIGHSFVEGQYREYRMNVSDLLEKLKNRPYRNGQMNDTDSLLAPLVWSLNQGTWQNPLDFWLEYAESGQGHYWGRTGVYPEYKLVNELDTLIIELESGPCLMEFFHERWRRANDVRRWDTRMNELEGCPDVFK